jgi:putative ubiquitin-RnfH superfamily antitoxin RatB of RatAB toxin-antitoxin module
VPESTVDDAALRVEVAYAEPQRAVVKSLRLAPGSQVADALRLAALDPDFAGVDLANAAVGIFGKVMRPDHPLREGDRIEIYRPLTADPKAARRARAKESRRKP